VRKATTQKINQVSAFEGMPTAIEELAQGLPLFILSSNSHEAITDFLGRYELENCFRDVQTGSSLFGKAKKLSSLIKKKGLIKGQCLYVGDETRDIEAAHTVGIKCLAVGWGYSTPEALKKYKPDFLISNPSELGHSARSLLAGSKQVS
jgi:phosphoglycolate phosphatase